MSKRPKKPKKGWDTRWLRFVSKGSGVAPTLLEHPLFDVLAPFIKFRRWGGNDGDGQWRFDWSATPADIKEICREIAKLTGRTDSELRTEGRDEQLAFFETEPPDGAQAEAYVKKFYELLAEIECACPSCGCTMRPFRQRAGPDSSYYVAVSCKAEPHKKKGCSKGSDASGDVEALVAALRTRHER